MLSGGDPRSLGNTEQVVELVLSHRSRLDELFDCIFNNNEIIRMRAGDALEKVCRQRPEWFEPFKKELLKTVPKIDQTSVQWHLAQMLSEITLSKSEQKVAVKILHNNLENFDDWIVVNLTIESLATFVRKNAADKDEFVTLLKKYTLSEHKSVTSRCKKLLKEFDAF